MTTTNNKKMLRKTTSVQDQPQLNSLLRLGHQVSKLKIDLQDSDNKALDLAKNRIVESPNTNTKFKKSVAKKVEFTSKEKIFNQLTSLDLSFDPHERPTSSKKGVGYGGCQRDPEPNLKDFHQPFHGEPVPMLDDDKTVRESVLKNLEKADNFITDYNRIQYNFEF